MFYFRQISPIGCLLWTVLLVWLFFKLKLYYIIFFILLLSLAYNLYVKAKDRIKMHKENQERNFEPEIGEVYKVCPFCGNDVKRYTKICPHCNNKFD